MEEGEKIGRKREGDRAWHRKTNACLQTTIWIITV